jgi:hypothetical protein
LATLHKAKERIKDIGQFGLCPELERVALEIGFKLIEPCIPAKLPEPS